MLRLIKSTFVLVLALAHSIIYHVRSTKKTARTLLRLNNLQGVHMEDEFFNIDDFIDNDDSAAKEMLRKGIPICYSDDEGNIIKEYPNGRKEIITHDFKKDQTIVLKVLEEGNNEPFETLPKVEYDTMMQDMKESVQWAKEQLKKERSEYETMMQEMQKSSEWMKKELQKTKEEKKK